MKNRTRSIVTVLIVSIFFAGCAYAETKGACRPGQSESYRKTKDEDLARRLNLTPDQDRLLKDAKAAHRAEMKGLFQALKEKRKQLKDALAVPGVTRQQVEPIVSEIKSLQLQLTDRRIDGIFKIKGILTPEQFQKLQAIRSQREQGMHKKHYDVW